MLKRIVLQRIVLKRIVLKRSVLQRFVCYKDRAITDRAETNRAETDRAETEGVLMRHADCVDMDFCAVKQTKPGGGAPGEALAKICGPNTCFVFSCPHASSLKKRNLFASPGVSRFRLAKCAPAARENA